MKKITTKEISLTKIITVKELAKYFQVSEKTAYELVRSRDFPSVKIGKQFRILVEDLKDWLEREKKKKK